VDNYQYDDIGNLNYDRKEDIDKIEWTLNGKVKAVTRKALSLKPNLMFEYDASGNRVAKTVIKGLVVIKTYYIRDAVGNVLSTYETHSNSSLALQEQYLYGSSRLGVLGNGARNYELTDHLGNVRAVVDEFKEVKSAYEYYAFGMSLAKMEVEAYRYRFNGKEDDGETGWQDYGKRTYNTKVVKFLSIDPYTKKYPELSPFQFASNRPIDGKDLDGLEFTKYFTKDEVQASVDRLKGAPYLLHQGDVGLCGIAAICYIWASNDYSGFSRSVLELYSNGKTTYNNYEIAPDDHLFEVDQSSSDYPYPPSTMKKADRATWSADWIIMSSLRDNMNTFYDYDGVKSDPDGAGTNYGEYKTVFKDLLGLTDINQTILEGTNNKNPKDYLTKMQARNEKGYSEIMHIDARLVGNSTEGRHAVVYAGEFHTSTDSNGNEIYHFKVYTWGNIVDVTATPEQFNNFVYGTTSGKKQTATTETK
jgi:RHS repeat-associated protein